MFQHDLIWLNQFSKKVNTLFVLCKPTLAYCLYFYDHFLSVEKKGLRYASGKLDGAGAARRRGRCTCPLVASRPSLFFQLTCNGYVSRSTNNCTDQVSGGTFLPQVVACGAPPVQISNFPPVSCETEFYSEK